MESSLRRVLGGATFQEIVRDNREDLMKRIAKQVNEEGKEFGLEVVDVRIKRADLPEQNQKNVFERMRAERQREAAEIRAEGTGAAKIRADADRQVTVVKAEATREGERLRGDGDAERNRIFAEAFGRDPGLLRLLPLHAGLRDRHEGRERHPHAADARQRVLQVLQQSQWGTLPRVSQRDEGPARRRRTGAGDRGAAVGDRPAAGPAPARGGGANAGAGLRIGGAAAVGAGVLVVWLVRG